MTTAYRSNATLNKGLHQRPAAVAPPTVQRMPRPGFTEADPAPDSSGDYDTTGVDYSSYHDAMVQNGHTKGMSDTDARAHTMRNWLAHGPEGQAAMVKKLAPIYGRRIAKPQASTIPHPTAPTPGTGTGNFQKDANQNGFWNASNADTDERAEALRNQGSGAPASAPPAARPAAMPPTTPGQVMDNVNAALKPPTATTPAPAIPRPPRVTTDDALSRRLTTQGVPLGSASDGKTVYDMRDGGKQSPLIPRPPAAPAAPDPLQRQAQALQDAARMAPGIDQKLNQTSAQLAVAKDPSAMQQRRNTALKDMGAVPILPAGGGVLKPATASAVAAVASPSPAIPRPPTPQVASAPALAPTTAPPAIPASRATAKQDNIDAQIATEQGRLDQSRPLADRALLAAGGAIAQGAEGVGKGAAYVADKTLMGIGKTVVGGAGMIKDAAKSVFSGDEVGMTNAKKKLEELRRQKAAMATPAPAVAAQ